MFSESLCHKVTIDTSFDQFGLCNDLNFIDMKAVALL